MRQVLWQSHVAEIQGLYGPLQVLEGRIQQIWALQQMQRGAWRTQSGRRVRIRQPGRWNRGAGPDFLEAVIELDGEVRVGAVELHLYREDWWRHGHHLDKAYNPVVLHVVLFSGGIEREIKTASGKTVEEWVLGPWLREDLESVAGGEPGLYGELAPELKEWLESDAPEEVRLRLKIGADRRWRDKESMARCLLNDQGWEQGLHLMTLFYLGYPFNRRAFYSMGQTHPPEDWQNPRIFEILSKTYVDSVRWNVGRPANRARRRLDAYVRLNRQVPDWFDRLRKPLLPMGSVDGPDGSAGSGDLSTREIRRKWKFGEWKKWLQDEVYGGMLNECLADRLWIDVCLPMLVSAGSIPDGFGASHWFHARPGMFPDAYRDLVKLAGIQASNGYILCNGWLQGLMWVDDQLRLERIRNAIGHQPATKRCLTS